MFLTQYVRFCSSIRVMSCTALVLVLHNKHIRQLPLYLLHIWEHNVIIHGLYCRVQAWPNCSQLITRKQENARHRSTVLWSTDIWFGKLRAALHLQKVKISLCNQHKGETYNVHKIYHFESHSSLISIMHLPLSRYSCLEMEVPLESRPFTKWE